MGIRFPQSAFVVLSVPPAGDFDRWATHPCRQHNGVLRGFEPDRAARRFCFVCTEYEEGKL